MTGVSVRVRRLGGDWQGLAAADLLDPGMLGGLTVQPTTLGDVVPRTTLMLPEP